MVAQKKIKEDHNQRLKQRIDERATRKGILNKEVAHHWPKESLEFAYAVAVVDVVLIHSDKATDVYNEIVRAWELPGCKVFIGAFKECLTVTNKWKAKALKARVKGEPLPDLPDEWFDTYFKNAPIYSTREPHNTDWEYLLKNIDELILVGFNRQLDQDNETWKVTPDKAPYLKSVIILRSQAEYCKVKLEDLNKYRQAEIDGKVYDINTIMRDHSTVGIGRQIYRNFVDTYQELGFTLKHVSKLLEQAEWWYKSRVVYRGPEQFCRENYNENHVWFDAANVNNAIRDIDLVVGYPRKWRKFD